MPPQGMPQLTERQVAVLRWWVENGASFDLPDDSGEIPDELRSPHGSALAPAQRPAVESRDVAAAVAHLRSQRIYVQELGENEDGLSIDCSAEAGRVDAGFLRQLEPLAKRVTWLDLSRCNVSNDALAIVAGMTHLEELDLSETGIDDRGVALLKGLENLKDLNLGGTRVTDAVVPHVGQMKQLRDLYLWNSNVTTQGIDRIRKVLPDARIIHDVGLD